MATHDENQEEQLSSSQQLSSKGRESDRGEHYFPRVGHAVNMRISQFELPDDVSGVGRKNSQPDD